MEATDNVLEYLEVNGFILPGEIYNECGPLNILI